MSTKPLDLLDPLQLAIYVVFAFLGYSAKFLLERYSKHKDAVRFESWKREAANLEQKLSQFFWPLYCRLKRAEEAWESKNLKGEGDELVSTFIREMVIKNHEEMRDIIQTNFHHFGGDEKLEKVLIRFLHHIDVYLALRSSGSQKDPIDVNQPWPDEITELVNAKLQELQTRYDSLLAKARRMY